MNENYSDHEESAFDGVAEGRLSMESGYGAEKPIVFYSDGEDFSDEEVYVNVKGGGDSSPNHDDRQGRRRKRSSKKSSSRDSSSSSVGAKLLSPLSLVRRGRKSPAERSEHTGTPSSMHTAHETLSPVSPSMLATSPSSPPRMSQMAPAGTSGETPEGMVEDDEDPLLDADGCMELVKQILTDIYFGIDFARLAQEEMDGTLKRRNRLSSFGSKLGGFMQRGKAEKEDMFAQARDFIIERGDVSTASRVLKDLTASYKKVENWPKELILLKSQINFLEAKSTDNFVSSFKELEECQEFLPESRQDALASQLKQCEESVPRAERSRLYDAMEVDEADTTIVKDVHDELIMLRFEKMIADRIQLRNRIQEVAVTRKLLQLVKQGSASAMFEIASAYSNGEAPADDGKFLSWTWKAVRKIGLVKVTRFLVGFLGQFASISKLSSIAKMPKTLKMLKNFADTITDLENDSRTIQRAIRQENAEQFKLLMNKYLKMFNFAQMSKDQSVLLVSTLFSGKKKPFEEHKKAASVVLGLFKLKPRPDEVEDFAMVLKDIVSRYNHEGTIGLSDFKYAAEFFLRFNRPELHKMVNGLLKKMNVSMSLQDFTVLMNEWLSLHLTFFEGSKKLVEKRKALATKASLSLNSQSTALLRGSSTNSVSSDWSAATSESVDEDEVNLAPVLRIADFIYHRYTRAGFHSTMNDIMKNSSVEFEDGAFDGLIDNLIRVVDWAREHEVEANRLASDFKKSKNHKDYVLMRKTIVEVFKQFGMDVDGQVLTHVIGLIKTVQANNTFSKTDLQALVAIFVQLDAKFIAEQLTKFLKMFGMKLDDNDKKVLERLALTLRVYLKPMAEGRPDDVDRFALDFNAVFLSLNIISKRLGLDLLRQMGLLEKAMKQKIPFTQSVVGVSHYVGIAHERDTKTGMRILLDGARRNDISCVRALASIYYQGILTPQNWKEAARYIQRDTQMTGNADNLLRMGQMYTDGGPGFRKNYHMAYTNYMELCERGHMEGFHGMTKLLNKGFDGVDHNKVLDFASLFGIDFMDDLKTLEAGPKHTYTTIVRNRLQLAIEHYQKIMATSPFSDEDIYVSRDWEVSYYVTVLLVLGQSDHLFKLAESIGSITLASLCKVLEKLQEDDYADVKKSFVSLLRKHLDFLSKQAKAKLPENPLKGLGKSSLRIKLSEENAQLMNDIVRFKNLVLSCGAQLYEGEVKPALTKQYSSALIRDALCLHISNAGKEGELFVTLRTLGDHLTSCRDLCLEELDAIIDYGLEFIKKMFKEKKSEWAAEHTATVNTINAALCRIGASEGVMLVAKFGRWSMINEALYNVARFQMWDEMPQDRLEDLLEASEKSVRMAQAAKRQHMCLVPVLRTICTDDEGAELANFFDRTISMDNFVECIEVLTKSKILRQKLTDDNIDLMVENLQKHEDIPSDELADLVKQLQELKTGKVSKTLQRKNDKEKKKLKGTKIEGPIKEEIVDASYGHGIVESERKDSPPFKSSSGAAKSRIVGANAPRILYEKSQ